MRSYHLLQLFSAILIVGSLSSLSIAAENESPHINWRTDYAQALNDSQTSHKPLLLFFTGSDWCFYCKKLDSEVFTDSQVIENIQSNFIPIVVDSPRSFALPGEIAAQNSKIKDKFQVDTYPTLICSIDDERPLTVIVGYSGSKDKTLDQLKTMSETQGAYRQIKLARSAGQTITVEMLDQFLSLLPEDILVTSWDIEIKEILAQATPESPLSKKWTVIAKNIDELKLANALQRELTAFRMEKNATAEQIVEFAEARLDEIEGHPPQQRFLIPMYSAFLSHSGDYEKSLEVAIAMEGAPWSDTQTRQLALDFQAKQYFRLGRIEEGKKAFHAYYSTIRQLQKNADPESDEESLLASELASAGCYEQAIACAGKVDAKENVPDQLWERAARSAAYSYEKLGKDLDHRADWLSKIASRTKNKEHWLQNQMMAAICYRADGNNEAAGKTLSTIDTTSLEDADEIAFGQDDESTTRNSRSHVKRLYSIARGDQADALRYLAKQAAEPGKSELLKRAEEVSKPLADSAS